MLHAEVISDTGESCGRDCNPRRHATWEASRPPKFETDAAEAVVSALHTVRNDMPGLWANATSRVMAHGPGVVPGGFGVHIAHLSSATALEIYSRVRKPLERSWLQSRCIKVVHGRCGLPSEHRRRLNSAVVSHILSHRSRVPERDRES